MEAQDRPGLRVQLLGKPCWRRSDGTEGEVDKKYIAVLAYVALRNAPVQRKEILQLGLWDGSNALYQAEHELRERLGRDTMTRGRTLELLSDVHCDVFEDLTTWPTQALLERCVFLDGIALDNQWVQGQRELWLAKVCDALLLRAHGLQRSGELPAALRVARLLNEMAPKNERGWNARMWLHYLSHDLTAARRAYEQLLKGMPSGREPSRETQELWHVVEQARMAPPRMRFNPWLSRPPRLVGREPQVTLMDDACVRGQAFVLCGEAGSGKSHLLADFCALHGPSFVFTVLPRNDRRAWASLAHLLNELGDRFETTTGTDDRILLEALIQHARAADEPAVRAGVRQLLQRTTDEHRLRCIAIDDLHYADEATVALCCGLAADGLGRWLHLGMTIETGAAPTLLALLDAAPIRRIELQPLNCNQVAELLSKLELTDAARTLTAAELYEHAGGTPMLLLETLRELPSDWVSGQPLPYPAAARRACQARLRALPSSLQPLVQLVAVLGLDAIYCERVLGRPAREFATWRAELQRLGVWAGDDFVHKLMRQAAVEELTPEQRLHWSTCAAAVLQHEPRLPPERLAALWEGARRWAEAAAVHLSVARKANDAGHAAVARTTYAQSAACARAGALDAEEFKALYEVLPVELLLDDPRPAEVLVERLGWLAKTAWQRAALAVARALLAVSKYSREAAAQGEALSAAAAAVRAAAGFDDLLCDALALDGAANAQAGQFDLALDASRRAMALAESLDRPRQQREIGTTHCYVCYETSRIGEGLPLARALFDAYEAAGDEAGAAAMEGHVATMLLWVDPGQALASAAGAVRRHRAIGPSADGPMAVMHRVTLAAACLFAGRFGDALDALHEGGTVVGQQMQTNIRAKVQLTLAHAWLLLGQDQAAVSALDRDDRDWPPAMRVQRCWALARAARLAGRDGDSHLRRIAQVHRSQALAHTAWLEWSRQGDATAVAAQMSSVQGLYEEAGMPGAARAAALRRVDRLLEFDLSAAATEALALQKQMNAHGGLHASTDLPEAWLLLARALEHGGHDVEAMTARRAGRDWIARALPNVHPNWLEGFRSRNPANRELLGDAG